jgi:hypothetical protein
MKRKLSNIYKEWEPIRDKLSKHRQGIIDIPGDIGLSFELFKDIFKELELSSENRNLIYVLLQFQLIEDLTQSKGRRYTPINKIHKRLLQRYIYGLVNFIEHDLSYIFQDDRVFDLIIASYAHYFSSTNIDFSSHHRFSWNPLDKENIFDKVLLKKIKMSDDIKSNVNFRNINLNLYMKILKEFDYYFLYDTGINEHAWGKLPTWKFFEAIKECSLPFGLLPSKRFKMIYIDIKTEVENLIDDLDEDE